MNQNQSMDATMGRVYESITGVHLPEAGEADGGRRYFSPSALLSILILLGVAFLATLPGWLPGRVGVPTDALLQFAPWANPDNPGYTPANSALLDQPVQFVPWMHYTLERLRHGQMPLWNPHTQLGAPFIANGQSAVFYPSTLIHMALPPTWSWTLVAMLKFWIAGVGMWLLAGRYGLRPAGRLLAGIAFMLCGFNVVWLNHPHMNVMAVLPWCILAIQRLIERPSPLRVLVAALLFALQFLGGHPASSIHLLLICGIVYALHLLWLDRAKAARAIPAVGVALVVGFLLAGVQWLPMLDYAAKSGTAAYRENALKTDPSANFGEDYWKYAAWRPVFYLGIGFPYINGYPPDRITPFELRHATHLPNTNEIATGFVGTVPLVLAVFALLALWKQRRVRVWAIIGLSAGIIAITPPGIDMLMRHVPGLKVAQNSRLIVGMALALAMLSGMGLDEALDRLRRGVSLDRMRKIAGWMALGLVAISVVGVIGLAAAKPRLMKFGLKDVYSIYEKEIGPNGHEHTWDEVVKKIERVHTEAMLTSVRLLIPATMLAAAWLTLRRRMTSLWPWITVAAVDLLAFAIPYNAGSPASTYRPPSKTIEYLQDQQKANPNDPFRFAGIFGSLHPDLAIMYGLYDVRGFDAVTSWRLWWWMKKVDEMADHRQAEVKRTEHVDRLAYRLLGMRYLIGPKLVLPDHVPPSTQAGWEQLAQLEPGATLYRNGQAMPRAWVVPQAHWMDTPEEVIDQMSAGLEEPDTTPLDFDPRQVVLLDRQIDPDAAEQMKREPDLFKVRGTTRPPRAPAITFDPTNTPERVHLTITNPTDGWLVLADAYMDGWVATVSDGWMSTNIAGGRSPAPTERAILPAYGVLRAVPIRAGYGGKVEVTFEYKPKSWRYGVMATTVGGVMVVMLLGFGLMSSRPRIHTNEHE